MVAVDGFSKVGAASDDLFVLCVSNISGAYICVAYVQKAMCESGAHSILVL